MDNKISFIAGWLLTTATTVTAMGLFKAALIGLFGGFFGLLGKELYFLTRQQLAEMRPSIIDWWSNTKLKVRTWITSKVEWIKSKF